MQTILIILVLLILFGGGGYGYQQLDTRANQFQPY